MKDAVPILGRYSEKDKALLWDELVFAIDNTTARELSSVATQMPRILFKVSARRIKNTGSLIKSIFFWLCRALDSIGAAYIEGKLYQQGKVAAVNNSKKLNQNLKNLVQSVRSNSKSFKSNPKEKALELAWACLGIVVTGSGFAWGSGGIDGDGGVPDLDIELFGIGGHRSVFTHSIVAGIAIETAVLSFLCLVHLIHGNLPHRHSEFWDKLTLLSDKAGVNFARGVSLGLAYHLGIDSTLHGEGIYRDMPFSMPMEGHQGFAATNAVTEGFDSIKRQTGDQMHEELFATFKEAGEKAKNSTKYKIKRAKDGSGFIVTGPSCAVKS